MFLLSLLLTHKQWSFFHSHSGSFICEDFYLGIRNNNGKYNLYVRACNCVIILELFVVTLLNVAICLIGFL